MKHNGAADQGALYEGQQEDEEQSEDAAQSVWFEEDFGWRNIDEGGVPNCATTMHFYPALSLLLIPLLLFFLLLGRQLLLG